MPIQDKAKELRDFIYSEKERCLREAMNSNDDTVKGLLSVENITLGIVLKKLNELLSGYTDTGTMKWRLEEFLKFIGENNWFVEEDGTVWENAFMEGYQVDAIKQFLGDESSQTCDATEDQPGNQTPETK